VTDPSRTAVFTAPKREAADSTPRWAGIWIPIVVPIVVFVRGLLGQRLLAPGDGYEHYLPLHILTARAWKAGQLPGWNPFSFSGYPLLATNQAAAFYPPNAVFVIFGPVLANNISVVVSFVLAGTGAFLLARHLCKDVVGATIAGLAFGLCGFMFGHLGHQAMIASIAWLPWALYGFELIRERFSPARLLLASAAVALSLIAGHSQMFALVVMVVGLYAAALTAVDWQRQRWRPLVMAALVVAVGAAISAVQLLPTASILGGTDRSRLDYAAATSYSFPKSHLPLLVFPYLFGNSVASKPYVAAYRGQWNLTELSGYPGVVALALAAAGLTAARRDKRIWAIAGIGLAGLLGAMGNSTPIGRIIYKLPVYGQFRSWGRYAVVFDLAVALLAAYGIVRLRERERKWALIGALSVPVLIGVAALVLPHLTRVEHFMVRGGPRFYALITPVAAAAAGAVAILVFVRWRGVGSAALVALVALDSIFTFGWFYEWRSGSPSPAQMRADFSPRKPPPWGAVDDQPGGRDRWLYGSTDLGPLGMYVDITDVKGLYSANGFDPLAPKDYIHTVGGMVYYGTPFDPATLWAPNSRILDLLRVTTVLIDPKSTIAPPSAGRLGPPHPSPGAPVLRYDYHPLVDEAFVVGAVQVQSRSQVVQAIEGTKPFDPNQVALVEQRCDGCQRAATPGPAGHVAAVRWGKGSASLDVTADRVGLVVLSQSWFKGWTATVDGSSAPVVRTDGLILGVPVAAGHHHVVFRYRPPAMKAGIAVSAVTIIGLAAWAIVDVRHRRRRPPTRAPAR